MSSVLVQGAGAVSPAGWGRDALIRAVQRGVPLPADALTEPGFQRHPPSRRVPTPGAPPVFARHPRFRRASPITHFAMAACLEALGGTAATTAWAGRRMGIVVGVHTGSIQYSTRFFGEVLQDPATASPLLFPETVFNAPASHIAAFLGGHPLTCTLVGDETAFLQALAFGANWLRQDRVDLCLVIGAEEASLLVADALRHFTSTTIPAEGAGAVLLGKPSPATAGVELALVTAPRTYAGSTSRDAAALAMRRDLPPERPGELLVDSRGGCPRRDRAETAAWAGWTGDRLSPRAILGQALCAASAWQLVIAWDWLNHGQAAAANVSLVGSNQQALATRLERVGTTPMTVGLESRAATLNPHPDP